MLRSGLIFIFLLFFSCGNKPNPKLDYNKIPSWINRIPSDEIYWYGIGSSNLKKRENARVLARQRALGEISEQLIVKIQSALLDVVESNNDLINEFSKSVIKTRVNTSLDFVEYKDSYKINDRLYILARLNKKLYYEKIALEKLQIEEIAGDLIRSSFLNLSGNNISKLILAVQTVIPLIDDSPMMEYPINSGKSKNIYRVALSLLQEYNDRIDIKLEPEILKIRTLIDRHNKVKIEAFDKKTGFPVSGIPIIANIMETSLKDQNIFTDGNGVAYFQIDNKINLNRSFSIIFTIDYLKLINDQTSPFIKLVPRKFPMEVKTVSPRILLIEKITNLGKPVTYRPLVSIVKGCFEDKYSALFVNDKTNADLYLTIGISTSQKGERLNEKYPYFMFSTGDLILAIAATGYEVMNFSLGEEKGADFDSAYLAGMDAIKKLGQNFLLTLCK